jgi:hypothetical protein
MTKTSPWAYEGGCIPVERVAFSCVMANAAMLMLDEEVNVIELLLWETLAPASGACMSAMASLMEMAPLGRPVAAVLELLVVVPEPVEVVVALDWVLLPVTVLVPPPPRS